MHVSLPELRLPTRSPAWKWWVCFLLLLATTTNYVDRLTLNLLSKPILHEFGLNKRNYGQLESAFGSAFALGAIVVGWLADHRNVRRLYPLAVLAWSAAGFATGLANGFVALLLCRALLGLAESGNWPCALRTTQRILTPAERPFGNSILQSGAAVGAVIAPLVILGLFRTVGESWRPPFLVVGALGAGWVLLWWFSVADRDLALTEPPTPATRQSFLGFLCLLLLFAVDLGVHLLFAYQEHLPAAAARTMRELDWLPLAAKAVVTVLGVASVYLWLMGGTATEGGAARSTFRRRFWVLATVVTMINLTWHFLRAWLPLFLQERHGYTLEQTTWFSMAYYLATDAGSLLVGYAALRLVRLGMGVHSSRLLMYTLCCGLTALTVAAALLPGGWPLLAVLLVIGFGALGVFPLYYSLSQELTTRHQGKLTGALGCVCWLAMALLQEGVGDAVQRTGSYTLSLALAGLAPLVGLAALLLFWGQSATPAAEPVPDLPLPEPRGERAAEGIRPAPTGVH